MNSNKPRPVTILFASPPSHLDSPTPAHTPFRSFFFSFDSNQISNLCNLFQITRLDLALRRGTELLFPYVGFVSVI
ncbi:hypothetical protein XENTR_v10004271 [Xenopus tropicalis]|nr:hypothetical protein XENTR_v10004271 [Xenopus tropicalis]